MPSHTQISPAQIWEQKRNSCCNQSMCLLINTLVHVKRLEICSFSESTSLYSKVKLSNFIPIQYSYPQFGLVGMIVLLMFEIKYLKNYFSSH